MIFTHLDWDTNFFLKKTGRVDVENETEAAVIRFVQEKSLKEGYNLIYIFCPQDFYIKNNLYVLVDRKTIYTCDNLGIVGTNSGQIFDYSKEKPTGELFNLAIQSGQFSRFFVDKNFAKDDFENLYKVWLLKSLDGTLADHVFVFKQDNKVIGFITLRITGRSSSIGLIAIDKDFHGKSIGTLLVNHVKQNLISKSVSSLTVATQMSNKSACSFYEKNGFIIKEIKNIYHYWNKNDTI
jgi:dTDP-4-amino-4,6-dideoxy-D-galactose acyltransferase